MLSKYEMKSLLCLQLHEKISKRNARLKYFSDQLVLNTSYYWDNTPDVFEAVLPLCRFHHIGPGEENVLSRMFVHCKMNHINHY